MESADNASNTPTSPHPDQVWEGTRKRSMLRVLNQLDRVQRSRQRLLQQQERLGDPQHWRTRADLLQSHIHLLRRGMKEISLNDCTTGEPVVFALDPTLAPAENIERHYRRFKKAKRGLAVIAQRLPEVEERIAMLESVRDACAQASSLQEFNRHFERVFPPARPLSKTPESAGEQRLPYRIFLGADGHEILVGKSGADNDTLTFRVAKPRDLWFHIAGRSGAHVVLRKRQKDEEPSQAAQVDAASLAVYFSPARTAGEGPVTVTEVRHIRRLKGAPPGTVRVLQYSEIKIVLDRDSIGKLLQRRAAQDVDASLPPSLPERVMRQLPSHSKKAES